MPDHSLYKQKPTGKDFKKFTVLADVRVQEYDTSRRGGEVWFVKIVKFKKGDVFWGTPRKPPVKDGSLHISGHTHSLYRFDDANTVAQGNPRKKTKRNPPAAKQMLTIGTLLELDIVPKGKGRAKKHHLRNKYLLWDGRNLHIAKRTGKSSAKLNGNIAKKHKKFHNAPANGTMAGEIPDQVGALKEIGLIKGLTYGVPRSIKSPGKNPYRWNHVFGDTGHKGGTHYPKKVMPVLMIDEADNLFIKRRKGNIFRVDTWLRG